MTHTNGAILADRNKYPIPKEGDYPWERFARTWHHISSPMRPAKEDLKFYWDSIGAWIRQHGIPRVLLLGVTPELYTLPWPKGTEIIGVDYTRTMIERHWMGPKDSVQCANWLSMDLPHGSRDIVLCDGGLHLLGYPQEQKLLLSILRSVLSDQGLCIFRLFALPSTPDSPKAVIKDLLNGRIINNNILKIRLSMALQSRPEKGVMLGEVYDRVREDVSDFKDLAARIGWTEEHMMTINNYKGLKSRFYYLTLEQTIDMFCLDPGGFTVDRIQLPTYQPIGCCPTVAFQCRP